MKGCNDCGRDSLSARLKHRIQFYGKVKSLNELKQTIYNDGLIATRSAEIVPQTGKMQSQQVETMLTHVTHKVVIRYNKLIEQAYQQEEQKKSMYIIFKGHRFNVQFILNPYFRNKELEIFVEEVIG
jgi:SPP1 family predicted phage head-tail adaptor